MPKEPPVLPRSPAPNGLFARRYILPVAIFLAVMMIMVGALCWMVATGHQSATPELTRGQVMELFQSELSGALTVKDEQGFSHNIPAAQVFFDMIHPVGTGKEITVLDAVLNKDDADKIQSVGLRLKLDWEGPLRTGSTTFQILYDVARNQYVGKPLVIQTDGITRDNIDEFATGLAIGAEIHDALYSQGR